MEEFILRCFFSGEELYVIQQDQVGGAVGLPKIHQLLIFQAVDHVGIEGVHGDVQNMHACRGGAEIADRLHQVGFSQACTAINEQGIVGLGGILRHRPGRSMGELVAFPDNEGVKGVGGIERDGQAGGCRFGRARILAGLR